MRSKSITHVLKSNDRPHLKLRGLFQGADGHSHDLSNMLQLQQHRAQLGVDKLQQAADSHAPAHASHGCHRWVAEHLLYVAVTSNIQGLG